MAAGNTVIQSGNVTRDPELRFLDNGTPVAQFSLAVSHRFKRGDEWVEEPNFFDVTVWNALAENVAESVRKGQRVVVSGRLTWRSWEDKDGNPRSKVEIVADDVGVSLVFGTAEYTKREKNSNSGNSSTRSNDPGPGLPDEEPF